jgi:hypothetical protein
LLSDSHVDRQQVDNAGEIAPLGRTADVGAMGKKLQKFQNKENGLLPSLTLTRYPLNAYLYSISSLLCNPCQCQTKAFGAFQRGFF